MFQSRRVVYFKPAQRILFYSEHTQKSSGCIFAEMKKLTWKGDTFFMAWIPHPPRSLAWSQLPLRPLCLPHPLHLLHSYRAFISLHKDNINKPDSSVRHSLFDGFKKGQLTSCSWGMPMTSTWRLVSYLRQLEGKFQYKNTSDSLKIALFLIDLSSGP